MAANVHALRTRAPQHPALARFDEIARLLTGRPHATAAEGITWIRDLAAALQIPGLRAYGTGSSDTPAIVAAASRASSMKTNPVALTPDELAAIVAQAI
jgi:alcohol dehydrogenase class IV